MMELTITSMTRRIVCMRTTRAASLKGKPAVSAICVGILALERVLHFLVRPSEGIQDGRV